MDLGVFIPIANNGWLISKTAPQYLPSFALNKAIVEKAERLGFGFALSMVRFLGFGGETRFWDYSLESFTLMAGLAAVTSRIRLFASTAILTMEPAVVARMAQTIDSIAPGRFGVNIVTGWSRPEFETLGVWPGDAHFQRRYDHAAEYVRIMRDLWDTGDSTLDGEFCKTRGAKLQPLPRRIEIVGAGQSAEGMRFVAECGDYNFIMGAGLNTPLAFTPVVDRLMAARAVAGRDVGAYVLFMIIAAETDDAAMATWRYYKSGTDFQAIANAAAMSGHNKQMSEHSSTKIIFEAEQAVNANTGILVGSYATVAKMLDEVAEVAGVKGIMLIFDDFLTGLEIFGEKVQPLMRCRRMANPPD
jgi:pyrimidine oxygenase